MCPSSDIETLFGHFGGDPGNYQEIGRENEASSARTRWPLLVTLDLKQPSIPAISQQRDSAVRPAGASDPHSQVEAQAPQGDAPATRSIHPEQTGSALLRSKAPLFARPHRRNIPPVGNTVKLEVPRGADRFSAIPQAGESRLAADEVKLAAAPAAAPTPVVAAPPVTPPLAAAAMTPTLSAGAPPVIASGSANASIFRTPAMPAFSARQAVSLSALRPQPASPVASVTPAIAQSCAASAAATRAAAPAAPAAQPPSILGKLFAPAAPAATRSAAAPAAAESAPAPLGSLFARLRGGASTPAAPAPHSWLTNGPRRS